MTDFHSPSVDGESAIDLAHLTNLFDALLEGSLAFAFHFQPIVDLRHASVAGYEALVHFPPEFGLPPDRCFLLATLCDRRLPLEEAVVRVGLRSQQDLPPNCFLSLNLSPAFLLSDQWDAVLDETPSLSGIILELTQQDLIVDYDAMRLKIATIRARGGTVAVDDTGSGFASLQHVMELKPDFVKLDRFFVANCHTDRARATLIEMMGVATNRLDAWIVAEGVETQSELDELIRLEVPLAQGDLLGHPQPAMEPLSTEIAADLRARVTSFAHARTIRRYLEPCASFRERDVAETALRMLNEPGAVVLVDQWKRPLELHENHPLLGNRTIAPPMKVQRASPPREVLQRALTRSVELQFDPLVVINEQGEFEGIVRIDRLMRGVLSPTDH